MKTLRAFLSMAVIILLAFGGYHLYQKYVHENRILKQMIERLQADSRIAEVLVTGVNFDEKTEKTLTTIKFLEYDADQQPLEPRYYTFSGNIIQFQSLVIRFDDLHIREGHKLKGRSAYIFWKVFMLDGENTQEFEITPMNEVPAGYRIAETIDPYEESLWKNFWSYALDPQKAKKIGVKNAQIEAPGTMFIPGHLYVINIEHDGGMRIDSSPLSPILRGERIIG